ncbi:MAG: fused MFS/spermidine synthase, partial [Candidatus Sumerlaeota bacterium]
MEQNSLSQSSPESKSVSSGAFFLILTFFFVSGATGLIYEVIWTRLLLNVFGASLYAVATVLAAFMGGLALGGLIGGRIADKVARPLRLYGIIEVLEAVTALLVPHMLGLFDPLYEAVYSTHQPSFIGISLLRFVLCFLVLLVPTTCMGATLPLLSRFLVRRQDALGGRIGALYTVNTTGAVIGTFLAGFVLIAHLGVAATVFLAGSLGLLMGIGVIFLSFRLESDVVEGWQDVLPEADTPAEEAETSPAPESAEDIPEGLSEITPGLARLVLVLYGVSGFIALAYQVLWSRTLPFSFEYLKNTTYSFSAMLTVFLIGLAAGSAIMSSQIDRQRSPLRLFGLLQILIGVSGILSLRMLTGLSDSIPLIGPYNADTNTFNWGLAVFNIFVRTALTIGLPTLLMGMTFPVAARICVRHLKSVGTGTGRLYAVNTLGAILGSFAAGFLIVPVLGLAGGIVALGIANLVLGLIVFLANPRLNTQARVVWAICEGLFILFVLLIIDTERSFQPLDPGHTLIAYEEGPLATVAVTEDSLGYRSILVDGVNVAGTEPYMLTDQKSLAHVPALLLENPKKALTVGFGSGGASWSYLQYKEFEQV